MFSLPHLIAVLRATIVALRGAGKARPDRGNLAGRDIAGCFELYFKSLDRRAERIGRRCAQKNQKRSFRNDPFTPLGHCRPRE